MIVGSPPEEKQEQLLQLAELKALGDQRRRREAAAEQQKLPLLKPEPKPQPEPKPEPEPEPEPQPLPQLQPKPEPQPLPAVMLGGDDYLGGYDEYDRESVVSDRSAVSALAAVSDRRGPRKKRQPSGRGGRAGGSRGGGRRSLAQQVAGTRKHPSSARKAKQSSPGRGLEHVEELLEPLRLDRYAERCVQQGYAYTNDIVGADAAELATLCESLGLRKPEERRLQQALLMRRMGMGKKKQPVKELVEEMLISIELGTYARLMAGYGFVFTDDLASAEEAEFGELLEAIEMRVPEQRRLRRALNRPPPPDPAATAAAEAAELEAKRAAEAKAERKAKSRALRAEQKAKVRLAFLHRRHASTSSVR